MRLCSSPVIMVFWKQLLVYVYVQVLNNFLLSGGVLILNCYLEANYNALTINPVCVIKNIYSVWESVLTLLQFVTI